MTLLPLLKEEAVRRGLLDADAVLDAATVFYLVRDMPYQRASDRRPETILREWRGTCSGKHYLLAALFRELGYETHVMAGVLRYHPDPARTDPRLLALLEPVGGVFVDVHNWVELQLPSGPMAVDATWPANLKQYGFPVNETFEPGQSQALAYPITRTYVVPDDQDPQAFKDKLLQEHFTPEELAAREAFIRTLSQMLTAADD
jgi:transglutaminase-like putative cysteine protease